MIRTTISSSTRKPGTFIEFDKTSRSRGLVPLNRVVGLVGMKSSAGTQAAATPIQVTSEAEADLLFGKGSELAIMCRAALKQAAKQAGAAPALWGVCLADGGTKATYTMTVTGPATEAGDVEFTICGRTIRAGVANAASAITVAASIVAAIKQYGYQYLPVTAAVGGGGSEHIVTLTAVNGGTNGNDIKVPVIVKYPAGIAVAVANGVSGATAYDLTVSLDVMNDRIYHAVAVANHIANDISDLKAYATARGGAAAKAWTICYVAETGTLATATALASGSNEMDVCMLSAEGFVNMPGEIAAMVAMAVEAETDVAKSFDGVELDLYPPPAASVPTDTEIETALAAGTTPLTVNAAGDKGKIVRLVTTLTTISSAPFEDLLDISNVRSLYYVGWQCDAAYALHFPRAKKNERTREAIKSVTLDVLYKCEELEILQNVDAHKSEVLVEWDTVVKTRANVGIPASVVPNLHQACGVVYLQIE